MTAYTRFVATVMLLSGFSFSVFLQDKPATAAPPTTRPADKWCEGPADTVTVQAKWNGNRGQLPACTMRQITAWRKGNVRFARSGGIGLEVSRVVDGRLPDPDFLKRPVGVRLLQIIPLDSAAAGADANGDVGVEGAWRLTRLPDDSYAVFDFRDTPFAGPKVDAELDTTVGMVKDLASKDPQVQYSGLRLFRERYCIGQVPLVLGMLGSPARVVVPDGMHFYGPRGGGVAPINSTLGREAAAALCRVAYAMTGSDRLAESAPPPAWNAWWEKVLKTDPFPRLAPRTIQTRDVMALRLNQTRPDLAVSQDGRYVVIGATRLEQPLDGMVSGICLLDMADQGKRQWVYRVGHVNASDINREPRPVRVGWGRDAIGIVFREFDELKFMSVDYSARPIAELRQIPLKGTANLSLAADADGWLLAYVSGRGAVRVVRLDKGGGLLGEPVELSPDLPDGPHFHDGIENVSVASLSKGAAVAFEGDKSLLLAVLDRDLTTRAMTQVDEPGPPRYCRSQPRVAWNGHSLLVAWVEEGGNLPDRLYSRSFGRDGLSLSAGRELADEAAFLAPPVPQQAGFVLGWVDHSISPNQVRLAMIGNDGKVGTISAIHQGQRSTYPIGLGLRSGEINVLCYDMSLYPHRFVLKSVDGRLTPAGRDAP